jgi:hypothetical protein
MAGFLPCGDGHEAFWRMACRILPSTSADDWRQKSGPKDERNTYPISFVECLGHDFLIICDEAIKTKQAWGFLPRKQDVHYPMSVSGPRNTTYALCPRVDVDYQLRVDHSTTQRSFWVFMMGEEESRDLPVHIVPVDLEAE